MDTTVTSSLAAVAAAASAGPKVAQHYLARPMLFQGRKFDLRILVAVRSFAPLVAAAWGEAFVRVANNAYGTDERSLFDFQTSFTSMRQRGFEEQPVSEAQLGEELHAACGVPWTEARQRIRLMLRQLLASAAHDVGPFRRGRALYGADVMLVDDARPRLLEVTFCPGVERPMAGDPAFFDKLFGYAFRGEHDGFIQL
jgi:tubulin--tyrosine ligase-like protein 12